MVVKYTEIEWGETSCSGSLFIDSLRRIYVGRRRLELNGKNLPFLFESNSLVWSDLDQSLEGV